MSVDILPLSSGDDEQLRKIRVAADELADQPAIDRSYYLAQRAAEIGVTVQILRAAVHAVLQERARRVAAVRLEQEREQKRKEAQRLAEQRELDIRQKREERERQQAKRAEEREGQLRAKEAERAKREAERVALQKAKEKAKKPRKYRAAAGRATQAGVAKAGRASWRRRCEATSGL